MEGARFHRLADLESEPGAGCDRLAGDELAIEPGGAGSCHLLGQRQVRAHGERQARIAPGVLPTPRLDNRPGSGVAGHLHIVEAQMMRSPVGAIDRSEEHTSELQSLMRISYAVFCLKQKKKNHISKCTMTN